MGQIKKLEALVRAPERQNVCRMGGTEKGLKSMWGSPMNEFLTEHWLHTHRATLSKFTQEWLLWN